MTKTTTACLTIEFHGYWHVGSGRGDGLGTDAAVIRTSGKLPYVPGRTIKGLLRDAATLSEALGYLAAGRTTMLFGTPLPDPPVLGTGTGGWEATAETGNAARGGKTNEDDERSFAAEQVLHRYRTDSGVLRISNARLGDSRTAQDEWETWARSGREEVPGLVRGLFRTVASTALTDGVARTGTLRVVEVAVPVTLHAFVDGPDDDWVVDLETFVLPMVRRAGKNRTRGLGTSTWRMAPEGGRS